MSQFSFIFLGVPLTLNLFQCYFPRDGQSLPGQEDQWGGAVCGDGLGAEGQSGNPVGNRLEESQDRRHAFVRL